MRRKLSRIFIPNRGEIACRIISACKKLGLTPILGFSLADVDSRARSLCEESICIGGADARESYLNATAVIARAQEMKADAIHPGYGFLAENARFARSLERAKIAFIGPSAAAMEKLGDKIRAKRIAHKCGVPILEGVTIPGETTAAKKILRSYLRDARFPLLIKASAGGGGRGMRVIANPSDAADQCVAASREAKNLFQDGSIFIEPYIAGARHVEVQIIGDRNGEVKALGTRDCSLQRRHQKVIEEAPASFLTHSLEARLCQDAERLCASAQYESLATVEFLVAGDAYFFLEVNTRLQVEHPVSEQSLDIDLVEMQIRIAQGVDLKRVLKRRSNPARYSIEARLCAEFPERDFRASAGQLTKLSFAETNDLRIETGFRAGDRVTAHYDSLLAKLIVTADTRELARESLARALVNTKIAPMRTNIGFLIDLVNDSTFRANNHTLLTANHVLDAYTTNFATTLKHSIIAAAFVRAFPRKGSAWHRFGSWTIRGSSAIRIELLAYEEYYSVVFDVAARTVTLNALRGDRSSFEFNDWQNDDQNHFFFSLNGITLSGVAAPRQKGVLVDFGRESIAVDYASPAPTRRAMVEVSGSSRTVVAHLPGKIVALKTMNGKFVTEGETLLVLESMKMEHAIVAPISGVISQFERRPGAMVQSGDTLLHISARANRKRKK